MCGIVAIYSEEPGAVSAEALSRGVARLHHRGPDGQRTWVGADARVGLGHARLAIIDLQTGEQPIMNEDESVVAVVNGELYDHDRIFRELEARGHRLRTRSDSEILVHLYEESGVDCLKYLRGEFAFVLWDARTRTLLAARDRFGIKPLHYAWHDGRLYLASEAKALFAAGVPARWAPEAFYQISYAHLSGAGTLFQGVRQIPPASYLHVVGSTHKVERYWDLDYPRWSGTAAESSPEALTEEIGGMLREAVRLRLRADVPVACYLSGGIDSGLLLALATELGGRPLDAFTIAFDDEGYDEEALARELATHVGSRMDAFRATARSIAENFSDAIEHGEMLPLNANFVGKFILSRHVRDAGIKVVLTGEGADEVFAGYSHFVRDMLVSGAHNLSPAEVEQAFRELERTAAGAIHMPTGKTGELGHIEKTLGYVPSWLQAFSAIGVRIATMFRSSFAEQFRHVDPSAGFLESLDIDGQVSGRERVHQSMYLWSRTFFSTFVLNMLGDRMEMAHSIEGRVPYLDHVLVERLRMVPSSVKIRGAVEKYVLREIARPVVPASLYKRRKHAFISPPSTMRPGSELHQFYRDVLAGPLLRELPFVDAASVRKVVDAIPNMDLNERKLWDPPLTRIVSACILQERFGLT